MRDEDENDDGDDQEQSPPRRRRRRIVAQDRHQEFPASILILMGAALIAILAGMLWLGVR